MSAVPHPAIGAPRPSIHLFSLLLLCLITVLSGTAEAAVRYKGSNINVYTNARVAYGIVCKVNETAPNQYALAEQCLRSAWTYPASYHRCQPDKFTFTGVTEVTSNQIHFSLERYGWLSFDHGTDECVYGTRILPNYYLTYTGTPDCSVGETYTAEQGELADGCYNGCVVDNLQPADNGAWPHLLQGTTTGATCTDVPYVEELDTDKMLGCTGGEPSSQTANPIDFAIGNKFFSESDYRGTGSFPIVFTRSYNSLDSGWRFNYTQRIDSLDVAVVVVRRPSGKSDTFQLINGTWTPDADVTARLGWESEANNGEGGWRYTLPNHTQEYFDANGRLLRIVNPQGRVQTIHYSGNVMTIEGPEGDSLTITFNEAGTQPISITDKNDRTTLYDFEGAILQQVTYPEGTTKQYLYEKADRPWLITGIIDENGHRSHTVDYDEQGRAIMSELADGTDRVEIGYHSDGTTSITNALGKETRFHFETIQGVRKIVKVEGEPTATCQGTAMAYQFDDNGFLTQQTDAEGNVTAYTRDVNGLILSQVEAKGREAERTAVTEWDSELRKPLLITRATSQTRFTYDEAGRTLSQTLIDRQTGAERTTGYTYNAQGLLASVDGPRTDVSDLITYHYDAQGRLASVSNTLGHTTDILGRDAYGRPLTLRDANGHIITLAYDAQGRLTRREAGNQVTTLNYDAVGNLTKVTLPDGTYLRYRYDNADRLTGIEDRLGNRITYILDALGNKTREEVFDSAGRLSRTQQKTYDELGRLLTSVGANGQTTRYSYDKNDNLTRTIDPLRQVHEIAYDGLSRLIRQTDPLGRTTGYVYDDEDRLTQVTDPNGNATVYEYNGLGHRTAQHSPDTGTTTFSHDDAGNILSKIDAKGQTTQNRYDALNRLSQTTFADGTRHTYTYDSCTNGIGRLCAITDGSGRTQWAYNDDGEVTERTQTLLLNGSTTTLSTAYQYDAAGRLNGITYPSGMQVVYAYADGHIRAVTINGEPLLSAMTYQPFGPITGWTWANGSHSVRGYDLDGRLINQTLGNTARTLKYDGNGNITAIAEPENTQAFGYDALNRLTAANDNVFNLAWSYDANGNRLSETDAGTVTPYTTAISSNRLMAVGGTAYQYDANGNLIQDSEHTYQFNARNRLARVDEGSTAEYRYNALGQRVYKKGKALAGDLDGDGRITPADIQAANGNDGTTIDCDGPGQGKGKGQQVACVARQTKTYAANGQGIGVQSTTQIGSREVLFAYDGYRLLGEYDTEGQTIQETVWLGSLPVATVRNGSIYYIHTDHLGTPRVISDSHNTEVWKWESDPFGVTTANDDPDGDGVHFSYNLRFPGQYYDKETGKHYNVSRDYDPATGRYIESDPIGLDGGLNSYAYVESNSVRYEDVYGLAKRDPNSEYCKSLERRIKNLDKELEKRYQEYEEDPLGLPERIGPGEALQDTRRGHITKINETDSRLKKNLLKYMDECGPPPPPVPENCPEKQQQGETQCSVGEDGSLVCRGWWGLGTPYVLTPEGPVFPDMKTPSGRIIIPRMVPVY